MPTTIPYYVAGCVLVIVWFYYKALVYRARIIEHLKTEHPGLYAKVMVDYSGMRLLDRLIADHDLVMRQANQETSLQRASSEGDAELDRLRTSYRRALMATLCGAFVFIAGAFLIAILARGRP